MPEATIVAVLGARAQRHRVRVNLTQAQLAASAGVSARTLERLESGRSIQFDNLVRILRALRLAEHLEQLVPDACGSPIQAVGAKSSGRKRASTRKRSSKHKRSGAVGGDEQ